MRLPGYITSLKQPWFDAFLYFHTVFDPWLPGANLLIYNDDYDYLNSAMESSSATGTNYTLVASSYDSDARGDFMATIGGPGNITVGGSGPISAVPEPGGQVALAGLIVSGLLLRRRVFRKPAVLD